MARKKLDHASPPPESIPDPPTSLTPAPPAPPPPTTWYQALSKGDNDATNKAISDELKNRVRRHNITNYEIFILYDDVDNISDFHSDRLYAVASAINPAKDILLLLHSRGGSIEPAYLISKTLKRLSQSKFVVVVPRRAKSAATLLALGADEIHMGMISQLGPIDPQSGGLPVLAVANALEAIAALGAKFPGALEMLTKYLTDQIPIRVFGYYQRVAESAVQYAERLLSNKSLGTNRSASDVATHLVNYYKDHGFVIDYDEATELLGTTIVKQGTPEYNMADDLYQFLDFVSLLGGMNGKEIWYVGNISDGFSMRDKRST